MGKVSYKPLFQLIEERIRKNLQYDNSLSSSQKTDRTSISTALQSTTDTSLSELVSSVIDVLYDALPQSILEGLEVSATSPISNMVTISKGKGTVGGDVYEIEENITVTIPFDENSSLYYIVLYKDNVLIQTTKSSNKLVIAKIVIPNPGVTSLIQDEKDDSDNAYIVNFTEYKLYGHNDKFEEDTLELLRDNIGDILADNLIGNIRLSENLKIINTQGTLELDSNSMKLYDYDENLLSKFNQNGVYFYDVEGLEMARFTNIDARIGNILINNDSLRSTDYVSGYKGFNINSNGSAEFENVTIRGEIKSSTFSYDNVSSVGGQLYIGNSSTLAEDVSSDDTTIEVSDSVFNENEVLTIKEGTTQEWLLVTDTSNAPIYTVTRDLANAYVTNPIWSKGTAIISTGTTNGGYILLDAVSDYSPFLDIAIRNSTTYDDYSTKVRLGNLGGITDDMYGALSGYGLYSDNVYLRGKLYAPDIKTAISGSRAELNTCCMTIYDDSGCQVFNIKYSGANAGDVTIGDLDSQYLCWQNALDKLTIKSTKDGSSFELSDGNIIANTMTLKDPSCDDCYSFLSSGQWYFHDELGNSNPYVKRLCAGEVTTGCKVCLSGWKGTPYVQLGIKDLAAYDPNYAVNCQKWCVYYSDLCCYYNSISDYGWCFTAHATLYKSAGEYAECVEDTTFGTSVYTHVDAAWTRVRNRFLLWCFDCASSTCYGYGTICYRIKYKCCEVGCAWTCCDYSYTQPHDSTVTLKTCYDECRNICFPSSGCWELQVECLSLAWCLTLLSGVMTCTCCRALSPCCINISTCRAMGNGTHEEYTCNDCILFVGDNPASVYCAYLCYYYCTRFYMINITAGWACSHHYICSTMNGTVVEDTGTICLSGYACDGAKECIYNICSCIDLDPNYDYSYISRSSYLYFCTVYGIYTRCFVTSNDVYGVYLVQCYCSVPSDTTCDYERLYSIKDYSESQTVLDPNGVLNYLAIGYV